MLKAEFFTIPSYIGYQINRDGVVKDQAGNVLIPYTYENGYLGVTVLNKTVHIHTLLAETFIPKPEASQPLEVNHIDGVKTNNVLSNLEWVTRSENVIHAYRTGLRSDNQIVEVLDLRDESVTSHYSLNECARSLGVTGGLLVQYFEGKLKSKVLKFYFILRKQASPWPLYNEDDVGRFINTYPNPVIVREQGKASFRVFESIAFVARELGIKEQKLRHLLRTRAEAVVNGFVLSLVRDAFELDSYPDEIKVFSDKAKLERISPKKPIPIEVTYIPTGVSTVWKCSQDFADYHQIKKNTFQKSVFLTGMWKDFKIEYLRPAQ